MRNPYRSFVRWLARRDIEAAWRERADAVNDAINWRGLCEDRRIVAHAGREHSTTLSPPPKIEMRSANTNPNPAPAGPTPVSQTKPLRADAEFKREARP